MNYTVSYVKIKSSWLSDLGRKKNVYQKIGYKGLFLYFQLYKFKLYNQDVDDIFLTSISFLRKETGYSTSEIFELLKVLKKAGVISLINISRWDYLLEQDGNVKDKDILHIVAADLPNTQRKEKVDKFGKVVLDEYDNPLLIDSPVTEDEYFIPVNLELFDLYTKLKLYGAGKNGKNIEKYVALYCLIQKWNNNIENKMNMSIEKIATLLGFDKDYIHKMIYSMNRNYLMLSTKRRRKNRKGYYFEHRLCENVGKYEKFKITVKDDCDKLVKSYKKFSENLE